MRECRFKAGRLSQKQYMKELADIKSAIQEEERILYGNFKEIFSPLLSECVHCNNLMESIETLIEVK